MNYADSIVAMSIILYNSGLNHNDKRLQALVDSKLFNNYLVNHYKKRVYVVTKQHLSSWLSPLLYNMMDIATIESA